MEHRPPSEGITLQSRTLSHWLVVRKVADLVADERCVRGSEGKADQSRWRGRTRSAPTSGRDQGERK